MSDITNVKCKMYTSEEGVKALCADEYISKIMQK